MSILSNDNGAIGYKTVIFILLLLFIVIHVGLLVTPMYMDAEQIKDEMITRARFALTTQDEEIVTRLAVKARELGLPLKQDDFKLVRDETGQRIRISTAWDVEIHFFYDLYPPYTVRTFHFEPIVEEELGKR